MTRQTEIPVFVPVGFPDYMSFKPEADTVEAHNQLVQMLQTFERKLNASNHLQAHQLSKDVLLPVFQLFYTWITAAQRDSLIHTHHLAEFMNEEHPDFLSNEEVGQFDAFFEQTSTLIQLLKPFVAGKGGEMIEKLGEEGLAHLLKQAEEKMVLIEKAIPELAEIIADQAEPEEDEDPDGEEEEEETSTAAADETPLFAAESR